jgi:NAD+ synthase (glutamine-hydrolysing)
VRIALAQINPTVGDIKGNTQLIIERARQARGAGAAIVAFPELAICGYPPEDLLLKDHFLARCQEALLEVATECRGVVALIGTPLYENEATYNAVAVLAAGEPAGWYRKILLPNYGVFDEKRYFMPGEKVAVLEVGGVTFGRTTVPLRQRLPSEERAWS